MRCAVREGGDLYIDRGSRRGPASKKPDNRRGKCSASWYIVDAPSTTTAPRGSQWGYDPVDTRAHAHGCSRYTPRWSAPSLPSKIRASRLEFQC